MKAFRLDSLVTELFRPIKQMMQTSQCRQLSRKFLLVVSKLCSLQRDRRTPVRSYSKCIFLLEAATGSVILIKQFTPFHEVIELPAH
jgi:hypothetical protein